MSATSFKGSLNIGESSLNEAIESNIVSYIDWGMLQLGAFNNVRIESSGAFGGSLARLRPVDDPRYAAGRVWESYRKNWVWESGVSAAQPPIAVSGIYVNNSFLPNGSGYYINYINGQVIFNSGISINSNVKVEYSYKWVDVLGSESVSWFRKSQTRSFRLDDETFIVNSGNWSDLAETRLQLPFIAVEVVGKGYEGYQIGGGQWVRPDILLHIVAEDSSTAKKIASILSEQNESSIFLYDLNRMQSQNKFPLNGRGELVDATLSYPTLIAPTGDGGFRYTSKVHGGKMRIFDAREQSTDMLTENVYHSKVRWSTEVVLPKI